MTPAPGTPLLDCPVAEFLDRLADKQPIPGGGGAAAITTAIAGGLVGMVARYSTAQLIDAASRGLPGRARRVCAAPRAGPANAPPADPA